MKHNLLTAANGLQTPIERSQRKSTISSIYSTLRTSLLALFLLMVGNSALWAAATTNAFVNGSTIYLDCSIASWDSDGRTIIGALFYNQSNTDQCYNKGNSTNYVNMDGAFNFGGGDTRATKVQDGLWKVTVPAANLGAVRFLRISWDDGNWCWAESQIISADAKGSNNAIKLTSGHGGSLCNATWAEAEIPSPYSLRGDFWLNGSGDWISTGTGPRFTDNGDGTASLNIVFNQQLPRITFCDGSTEKTASDIWDDGNSTGGLKNKFDGYKVYFNQLSGTKKVTLTYTSGTNKLKGIVSDYDTETTGWHLFVDDVDKGEMNASGVLDVADLSGASGGTAHTFYITDGSATTWWGVNKFGGIYIDETNSNVSYGTRYKCYGDKFNASLTFPIVGEKDLKGRFKLTSTSNVRFTFDGGKITINTVAAPAPATTYTVTLHPNNGGSTIVRENVPEGSNSSAAALNLAEVTYGLGTATWYTNEACTEQFTTVTSDMDLYAKWGVSGNFYIVGDLHMYDNAGNWDNNKGWQLTYPSGSSTCAVSYIAPTGVNRFEIIKDRDWNQKIKINNSYTGVLNNTLSDVTLSEVDGHMQFTISESTPQKVTVHYDGKVWVTHEAYTPKYTGWRITADGWDGQAAWSHSTLLDNTGKAIIRNVSAGQHQFKITDGDDGNVGIEEFNALYVDITNPSQGLTWASATTNYGKTNVPQSDNQYRNCTFTLENNASYMVNGKYDLQVTFDGGKIRCDILPKYTVSFNSNGGSEVASQTMFEGRTASEPADPTRDGYEFDSWRISSVEGDEYDFDSPVSSNVSLVAKWNQIITHTVSFNMDGGIPVLADVVVNEGNPVAQPADPTKTGYNFVEWQLSGSTYNFESPVMDDIELVAVWSFKAIESVYLNKSTLILYENSDPQTLTPSYLPADVLGVTYEWIVAPAGVVSVVNGVVNVVAPGTATITCTATDAESNSQNATCSVTVYEGEGCEMEEQSIFSHVIFGNSTTGGSASNNLLDQAALNPGMESTCRTIKMYYNDLTSEFTADEAGVVKAKSGLSDHSDEWYEIKGGTNPNSYDGNFYYLKNVATGGYITRGAGIYGGNDDWKFYTTVTTPTNGKTNLYQFIYAKKDNQDNQKRICSVWNYNGTGSNQTYGLHRRNQDWADNYGSNCPNPMIVFGRGVNQGNSTLSVNFTVVATGVANPDYLSTPIVYDTRSYYRFSADAAVSLTLDKKLRAEDKVVVYCYNPSNAASNGALYINNNKVSDIQITANSALAFEYVAVDGDAGVNTIEVKSDDSNFCMASIEVLRSLPVIPQDAELTWSAPATYYTTVAAGNFTFTASSAKSSGAITYSSDNETVATVENGVVTPLAIGTAHITASIEQYNCFGESNISYAVVVEQALQEAIDANSTLTLAHDYTDNVIINKPITIDAQGHSIGNLTVQQTGDLTLISALTVNDFTICAKAGNTSTPAASGQVRSASNLTVNGNAYFLYTVDPSGHVQYGWYDFTVPFPVNAASGIKGIENSVMKNDFANGVDYAIMEYLGEKQGQGQYPYKKFSGVMQPNKLYSITLDDEHNYNTLRMQKTTDGALVASNTVTLEAYSGDAQHQNWNGVGNGTLHHADAGVSGSYIQVYQSGDKTFLPVSTSDYSLVVGTAFMVQEEGTMTLSQATHSQLLAPKRYADVPATAIQIASEGQPFSDQLFISASETGGQAYTPGIDVAKAGNIGNVNVPQIWTNAYDTKLCVHEAQLINGEAQYNLSLYAPAAGTYTLTSMNIPAYYTLYLTQNGTTISELSDSYTLNLNNGITTEYGLLLTESYKMPTGLENVQNDNVQCTKVLRNGVLYILHNGKVYNAQGGLME